MAINFSEIIGIDEVYCISLQKNKANWDSILQNITANGFPNCSIFEAINGSQYRDKNLENMVGIWQRYILKNNLQRTNHEQFNKFGALGCYLSHVGIWQDAKQKGYKKILVFEDDVTFETNFIEELKNRIKYIPKEYDVLFLDVLKCYESKAVNQYFKKILSLFFGTHSYIITEKAIDTMLKTIFPIELQIDAYMAYSGNISELSMYYTQNLCNQDMHISSIQSSCVSCDNKHNILISPYFSILLITAFIVFTVVIYGISKSNR